MGLNESALPAVPLSPLTGGGHCRGPTGDCSAMSRMGWSGCLVMMEQEKGIPWFGGLLSGFFLLLPAAGQPPEPGAGRLRQGRPGQGHLRPHLLLAGQQGQQIPGLQGK